MKCTPLVALVLSAAALAANAAASDVFESTRWREFVRHVEQSYYKPVDPQTLKAACMAALSVPRLVQAEPVDACIGDALAALDRESSYMAPKEFARHEAAVKQPLVGVGLELAAKKPRGEGLVVVTPIAGGAADRGGVKPGDVIVEIDGHSVLDMADFETAMDALRGSAGSRLRLGLQRKGASAPVELTLVRQQIVVMRVRARPVSEGVAYLRVSSFADGVDGQLAEQAERLARGAPRPPSLILDLRNNPGGELDRLVKVASFFCAPGTHLLTLSQQAGPKKILSLDGGTPGWLRTVPLVVLVNRGTGGGAEALAQALREHRGAKLIGETTFGAGLVTTRFVLDGATAVWLETARMESALGVGWLESGLAVDAQVEDVSRLKFGERGDPAVEAGLRLLPGS